MSRSKKTAILAGLVLVAICTALPFLRDNSQREKAKQPTSRIRQGDVKFEVPLHVAPQQGKSPAIGLRGENMPTVKTPPTSAAPELKREASLQEFPSPPPNLPIDYRSPFNLTPVKETGEDTLSSDEILPLTTATSKDETVEEKKTVSLRHKIVDGDTLLELAEKHLGDRDRYLEIYQANRNILPSPEALPLGVEITIPPRD